MPNILAAYIVLLSFFYTLYTLEKEPSDISFIPVSSNLYASSPLVGVDPILLINY
jgi:hypothetical protein